MAFVSSLGLALVSASLAVAGCVPRRSGVGVECEINSECATPLVCRLGHCRVECVTSADCSAGLACLLDAQRIGSCQLGEETSCTLASDCVSPLVCRFERCTNPCETDRDCPGGSRCEHGAEGAACIDRSVIPCALDTDCDVLGASGMASRCVRGRCREECRTDRDCRNDFWCDDGTGSCLPLPRFARPDAGADAVSRFDAASLGADAGPTVTCDPMPFPLAWEYTEPLLLAGTVMARAGRRLVLVGANDSLHRGGAVFTLDLDTHGAFARTPFAAAHPAMDITTDGTRVLVTGGSETLEGGPERDLFEIDPLTGASVALGFTDASARSQGALAFCGDHVVRAGGRSGGSGPTGSTTIDVFDLSAPGTSATLSLSVPALLLAIATTSTHAYVVGGASFPVDATPRASNRLTIIDCAAGTLREVTMPAYYGNSGYRRGTVAGVDATHLYVWGLRYPDDATSLDADAHYESIDVFELATETWTSYPLPPELRAYGGGDIAYAGGRIFRFDQYLSMFELGSETWRCVSATDSFVNERVFSDGTMLYLVQINIEAAINEYRVRAYTLP